jgi:hypothetical protein
MLRWGQDGLALLSSAENHSTGQLVAVVMLLRGPFVTPQLLQTSSAATLVSSPAIAHGSVDTMLTLIPLKQLLENHRFIMALVSSSIEECHCTVGSGLSNNGQLFLPEFEFLNVLRLELCPTGGVMTEPFAQFGAWANLFQPHTDVGILLLQSPRPESVHEDASPVFRTGSFINPLDLYVHSRFFKRT